jgi:hypothetical protein
MTTERIPGQPDMELGRIFTTNGRYHIQLTPEDALWAARGTSWEIHSRRSDSATEKDESDVLWTLTQRAIRWRQLGKDLSFSASTRSFSQPINPQWAKGGVKCRPGSAYHGTADCSDTRLEVREMATAATWADLRERDEKRGTHVVEAVQKWAQGQLANTVPRATNFAVPAVSRNYVAQTRGAEVVAERGGHWYISDPPATRWPFDFVQIISADGTFVAGVNVSGQDRLRYAFQNFFRSFSLHWFGG